MKKRVSGESISGGEGMNEWDGGEIGRDFISLRSRPLLERRREDVKESVSHNGSVA